eukprot:TRINITY_DN4052_c0_g1_i3.p2 TRINITY_DN4052_c0_g1~~TRINITY_DN4052_c0_g1_i3.p2  ORF type:complete len:100 (-),score=1.51 TRINITY_DN4052_c0_g1_i3:184-483(-)
MQGVSGMYHSVRWCCSVRIQDQFCLFHICQILGLLQIFLQMYGMSAVIIILNTMLIKREVFNFLNFEYRYYFKKQKLVVIGSLIGSLIIIFVQENEVYP